MQHWPLLIAAAFVGSLMPLQAGINAQFGRAAGHGIYGAMWNFIGGLIALTIIMFALQQFAGAPKPSLEGIKVSPWWSFLGGLCGASMVFVALTTVPKVGAQAFLAALVTGQVLAAIPIDKFGLANIPVREITIPRLIGVGLIISGMLCIVLLDPAKKAAQ